MTDNSSSSSSPKGCDVSIGFRTENTSKIQQKICEKMQQTKKDVDTVRNWPSIQQMILANRDQKAPKIALVHHDLSLTYDELCGKALALCALIKKNFGDQLRQGEYVGIEMARTPQSVVSMLACYLGRYPVNPLDLQSPPKYRDYKQSAVKTALILRDEKATAPTSLPIIRVDEIFEKLAQSGEFPVLAEAEIEIGEEGDLIFIEWTSGSTGVPKGYQVTQSMMNHWLPWRQIKFPQTSDDPDISAMNLFWTWYWHIPLCGNGTLVIIPDELMLQPVEMVQYLIDKKVTRVDCLTPSFLTILAEYVPQKLFDEWTTLRYMYTSGEACPLAIAKQFFTKVDPNQCRLINFMSTTETAADICACDITPFMLEQISANFPDVKMCPISDGTLDIWNNSMYLDEFDVVHVRGRNVNPNGYFGGVKAERFWRDKTTGEPCVNLGDLGRFITVKNEKNQDVRYLALNGRADAVVKVRGFRVDLYGVETVLVGLDEVIDCACLLFNEKIVCFIESPPERPTNASNILKLAREKMPDAHVPSDLFFVDSLPRTATGKRDRVALKTLLESRPRVNSSGRIVFGNNFTENLSENNANPDELPQFVEKMDEFSQNVYKIWSSLLNTDLSTTSWDASFFEIGGHSLLAVKLAAKLGLKITDIFVHHTMAMLAKLLRAKSNISAAPDLQEGLIPKYLQENQQQNLESQKEIYVVGMSGRFPGAQNISEFWDLLKSGKDGIVDVQPPRHGIYSFLAFSIFVFVFFVFFWIVIRTGARAFSHLFFFLLFVSCVNDLDGQKSSPQTGRALLPREPAPKTSVLRLRSDKIEKTTHPLLAQIGQ